MATKENFRYEASQTAEIDWLYSTKSYTYENITI